MNELSSVKSKLNALYNVLMYRPVFIGFLVISSIFTGLMEGIGLGFIYPIVKVAESGVGQVYGNGSIMQFFTSFYKVLGIPFTLETLLLSVSFIIVLRYSASFGVGWLKTILSKRYETHLKKKAFQYSLEAEADFFDNKGTDKIYNHALTEAGYSSKSIMRFVELMKIFSLVLIYLVVMLYISPILTLLAIILLGGIMSLLRFVVEPAIHLGSEVAEANEKIQEQVQAGIDGAREVKLLNMSKRIYSNFEEALEKYRSSEIKLNRNEIGMKNFYKMSAALSLFLLIYIGFTYTALDLAELGIFLVAMFQLAPKVSSLNSKIYSLEGYLSHFIRTQKYIEEVERSREDFEGRNIDEIDRIVFDGVDFSYEDEKALNNISFNVSKGDFIAFVGKSGAGKSTVASLIPRLYEPVSGDITCSGTDIREFNLKKWRSNIAVVRQQAFLFNMSLAENVRASNPDATREQVKEACKIAQVDEFIDDLPNGYDSELGEDGIKLSGGQRQRIAIARALLKDADILILDEATSDLDSHLEEKVHKAIEETREDYGIIAIAHRLSTVKNADKIHTMKKGKIIEEGTHEELVQREGAYYDLYKTQKTGKLIK